MKIDLKFKTLNLKLILSTVFLLCVIVVAMKTGMFNAREASATWYSSGGVWTNRKVIDIDKSKVGTTTGAYVTDFPMLFSVTDPDLRSTGNGGKVGQTDGGDILFTSSDGSTKLYHEIEKYTPTTGEIVAWVRVPFVSSTSTTRVYVYYGDDDVANQWDVNNTWNSNYRGVWHLNETVTDEQTSATHTDSTSNANNGGQNNNSSVTGKMAGGQNFDNNGDFISVADANSLDITSVTMSAWYKPAGFPAGTDPNFFDVLIMKDAECNSQAGNYGIQIESNGGVTATVNAGTGCSTKKVATSVSGMVMTLSSWAHIVGTYDGASLKVYLNGVLASTTNTAVVLPANTAPVWIGKNNVSGYNYYPNGAMDEVRIMNTAKDADWVATEYQNQSNPAGFYSYGGEQKESKTVSSSKVSSSATVGNTSWYNSSWPYRRVLEIQKSQVGTTTGAYVVNFPIVFVTTHNDLRHTGSGGKVGNSDGTDILFTDFYNNKLSHDIELYTSSTGQLIAWVKVPFLSSTSTNYIYMYYGNSGAADQQSSTAVWDSNFIGVWHVSDGDSTTASFYQDATANNYDITMSDPGGEAAQVATPLGYGMKFGNSTPDEFWTLPDITSNFTGNQATFCMLLKLDQDTPPSGTYTGLAHMGSATLATHWPWTDGKAYTSLFDTTRVVSPDAPTGRVGWHQYCVASASGTGNYKLYFNGTVYASGTRNTWAFPTAPTVGKSLTGFVDGAIDEFSVSNTARNSDWIRTEYNSQLKPTSFIQMGGEEVRGNRVNSSNATTSPIKIRGGVKFR